MQRADAPIYGGIGTAQWLQRQSGLRHHAFAGLNGCTAVLQRGQIGHINARTAQRGVQRWAVGGRGVVAHVARQVGVADVELQAFGRHRLRVLCQLGLHAVGLGIGPSHAGQEGFQLNQRGAAQLGPGFDAPQFQQIGEAAFELQLGRAGMDLAAQRKVVARALQAQHWSRQCLAGKGSVVVATAKDNALREWALGFGQRDRFGLQCEAQAMVDEVQLAALCFEREYPHACRATVVRSGQAPIAQAIGLAFEINVGVDQHHVRDDTYIV